MCRKEVIKLIIVAATIVSILGVTVICTLALIAVNKCNKAIFELFNDFYAVSIKSINSIIQKLPEPVTDSQLYVKGGTNK